MPPLGRRRVQHGDNAVLRTHQRIGIVFNIIIPEIITDEAVNVIKFAAEKPHQVDHVDALIEQDTATGDSPFNTPT